MKGGLVHAEVEETLFVNAPVDVVWSLYDDVEAMPTWAPSVRAASVVGGGRKRLGAWLRFQVDMGGIAKRLEEEIVRYDPPSRTTVKGRLPGWVYSISLHLSCRDGGTECKYRCSSEYGLLLRPLVPLLERMNRDMLRQGLAALKGAAERRV
jgi:hypothetical protein